MCQSPGKVENLTFLTQICSKNGFRLGISGNLFRNKIQHLRDLGLEFQKTNVGIKIRQNGQL